MLHTDLTAERLRELLDYDPETGAFHWLVPPRGSNGSHVEAGWERKDGYRSITVDKSKFLAHRLAWLYMTGACPTDTIDHKDGNPRNNRWANLRAASRSQNMANQRTRASNMTQLKGVSFSARDKRWFGRLVADGQLHSSGYLNCPAAAHLWYVVEANKRFGEYARVS